MYRVFVLHGYDPLAAPFLITPSSVSGPLGFSSPLVLGRWIRLGPRHNYVPLVCWFLCCLSRPSATIFWDHPVYSLSGIMAVRIRTVLGSGPSEPCENIMSYFDRLQGPRKRPALLTSLYGKMGWHHPINCVVNLSKSNLDFPITELHFPITELPLDLSPQSPIS
jgi:hypothetical protein